MHHNTAFPRSQWPEPYRTLGSRMDSSCRSVCGQFLSFCVANGLEPAAIDETSIMSWLDGKYPPKPDSHTRCRALSRIFRMLTDAYPATDYAWLRHLSVHESPYVRKGAPPGLPRIYSVPLQAWPAAWQRKWSDATGHLLQPGLMNKWARLRLTGAKPWRKSYAAGIQDRLGSWIWTMREAGLPVEMTPESLQLFIDVKRERGVKLRSIAGDLKKITAGLDVVSVHGAPTYLRLTAQGLAGRAAAEGDLDNATTTTEHPAVLAALGLVLIERARTHPLGSLEGIRLFRDGALFYTLAFRPLRVGSLLAMRIGEELQLFGSPIGRLCLPASIMKAKRRWGIDLNTDLSKVLSEWITVHRRYLSNSLSSPFVFISHQPSKTGALTCQGAGRIVRRWTQKYLGRSLSPHDFRHAAGTLVMDELPDMPWIGSAMLQQRDPNTLKIYSKGHDVMRATDRFGQIVDSARRRMQNVA